MKVLVRALPVVLVVLAGYLLLWPVPVDPAAWDAPEAPKLSGVYEPNEALLAAQQMILPDGLGPEDVALDAQGHAYVGLEDGRILRYETEMENWSTFSETGGRPLGLDFDASGNLIVADAVKGLLSIAPSGNMTVLSTEAGGVPFKFTDDVEVAPDGFIYFSDASSKFGHHHWKEDAIEHRPNGRLLAYDPSTGQTKILMPSLHFANGVAVAPDNTYVLVNETWKYRVWRYWLEGERAGESEVFIDNLPGFPDGISRGDGVYWVALASPRNPTLDGLSDKPFIRKIVARLPAWVQPKEIPYGFVLGLDADANVVYNLHDPTAERVRMITSVQEHQGMLYFGNLKFNFLASMPRPARTP